MAPENLESRVTALEVQVGELRGEVNASKRDAAAARILAGAADRDVGEIRDDVRDFRRATVAGLNALREDMTDGFRRVDAKLERIDESLEGIDEKFDRVDNGFVGVRSMLDMTAAGQQHIAGLIQSVIDAQGGIS